MLFDKNKKKFQEDDDSFESDEDDYSSYKFSDSISDKVSIKPTNDAEEIPKKINSQIKLINMKKQTRKTFTPEDKPKELELFDV